MAKQERQVHMSLYPGWTARDNYAKHKKKKRRKDTVRDGGSKDLQSVWVFNGQLVFVNTVASLAILCPCHVRLSSFLCLLQFGILFILCVLIDERIDDSILPHSEADKPVLSPPLLFSMCVTSCCSC